MKQDFFNSAYTGENTRRDFLNFLRVKLFSDAMKENIKPLGIGRKTNFFEDSECFSLWEIQLDKKVSILEMKQKSQNDPRITLTRDAFKIMEDKWMREALVVFYSADSSSWRLSLLTLKKTWWEKEISDPKRYSFLLWVWEKTKTPEKYLQKQITDFSDLVSRFDVEVVRKEFFNHYLTLYIKLYKAVNADREFVKLLKSQRVDLVSFTKNLLWKIIFLYFIQKKWWLGVEKWGEFWKDGDKNFMRNFFNNFNDKEKVVWEDTGYFYNDYLEHLFYEGLNKDNRQEDDVSNYFNFRVPYLNGGLFKKDYENWNINKSVLSNEVFSNGKDGILDIFDTYNFTIDEDDLYDSDIAVDPEMLGRIFEKMISISSDNIDEIVTIYDDKKKIEIDKELNKKFGAFYTPREIVHYMTKESIIAYLVNNLSGKKEEKEEKIRLLFEYKDKYLTAWDMRQSELSASFEALWGVIEDIDVALSKVKILDPAVGSGAFPMGILHEVSTIRFYIYDVFYRAFNLESQLADYLIDGKVSMYKIKREIIQNNIYWVDIEPWAIDIARLRFWLSLVVDEEQPEPLPNFEFKFVCANTLIPLAEVEEQTQLQLEDSKELNVETLRKYMVEYYNTQKNKEKEDMQWQIKGRIEKFLWIGKNISMDLFSTKSERTRQLETYHPFKKNHSASFFDPSLMMGTPKFDIVVWNPPYIKEYDNRDAFNGIRNGKYYMWKMDIWYYFACYTLDFLKDGWVQSFIAQNNWITSFGAKKMREKVLQDSKIKEFIDFWDFKVFQDVWIQTMIYILEKTTSNSFYDIKYSKLENKLFDNYRVKEFLEGKIDTEDYRKYNFRLNFSEVSGESLNFVSPENIWIINKIKKVGKFYLRTSEVAQWIVYPQDYLNWKNSKKLWSEFEVWNGIFVLSNEEKNNINFDSNELDIIKPTYSTNEIWRYFWNKNNQDWVIYTDSSFKNIEKVKQFPNIKNHLDKFRSVITSDNKPYWLHRARNDDFFTWEKILVARKCIRPAFSLIHFDSYVSATFYSIKSERIPQVYLTGLLNSKLIQFWLKNKGKMQWSNYQLDKEPLVRIPIFEGSSIEQFKIIEKVDSILKITKESLYDPKNPPKEQLNLEAEIDRMVYELYGLSEEEVKVVEESLG